MSDSARPIQALRLCPDCVVSGVALGLLAAMLPLSCLGAQPPTVEKTAGVVVSRHLANAILHWVEDYGSGRFALESRIEASGRGDDSPMFCRLGQRGGVLSGDEGSTVLSSFGILQRLVAAAEKHPSAEVADALLDLASTGLEKDMFDHRLRQVRDLGHFAILRIEAATVWNRVHQIAMREPVVNEAGNEVESEEEREREPDKERPFVPLSQRAMWRVAAVRLLGMKGHGVFRSSIEKCLSHSDGRVRLAASESICALHNKESLPAVTRVLSGERHPMVVVTLVQAMQRILNQHAQEIPGERSELGLRTALARIGQVDWRSDMAIVQLLHNHPIKPAVPSLIALMRLSRGQADPILKIINGNASRFLGLEAHRALRKLTGALIADDPEQWQQFWDKEKDNLVVRRVKRVARNRTISSISSGGSFYGIPVLGSDVVFVLDTSGSMKERVQARMGGPITGPKSESRVRLHGTRLQVACRQTLRAVQGMPRNSKFSIVTFSGSVRVWNRRPVKIGRSSRNTAARILGRLQPNGGTNVFEALVHILEGSDVGYGDVALKKTDEVFVLSDGQPSAGQLTRPDEILAVVRDINTLRKVRINTVFAGTGSGSGFMKRLAEENGGVFVHQK